MRKETKYSVRRLKFSLYCLQKSGVLNPYAEPTLVITYATVYLRVQGWRILIDILKLVHSSAWTFPSLL